MSPEASHFLSLTGLIDLVMAGVLLEGLALAWWYRRTGDGLSPRELVCMLSSGLCLMLALRLSLAGAHPAWAWLWLAASGVVHAIDLRLRQRRVRAGGRSRDED
jgi:hypothetical protein